MQYVYHYVIEHMLTNEVYQGLYISGRKIDNDSTYNTMLIDIGEKFEIKRGNFRFINFSYLHSKDEL